MSNKCLAGFVAKIERIDGVFRQIRSQAHLRQETIWSTLLFYRLCKYAISSGHEHLAALAHGLLANAQSQPGVVCINGGTRVIVAMPIFNSNTFSSTSCVRPLRFFDSHE
jgi:hypothetical protein